MKKNLRYWAVATVGAVVALGFTSCVYDPYYPSSVGASYSTGGGGGGGGYGDGYGYGGSSFSTSLFVGTGNPQWGYDPGCHSYYDYRRRSYYDPYLNGYYPVGYRPQVVYGAPHPYGWSSGRDYIRPPEHVSGGYVSNYRDRESSYRNSSYGWARQVRRSPGEINDRDERSPREGFQRSERSGYQQRSERSGYQNSGVRPYSQDRSSSGYGQIQRQPSRGDMPRAAEENQQRARQDTQRGRQQEDFQRSARQQMQQSVEREAPSYNRPVSASRDESRGQRAQPQAERSAEQPQRSSKPSRGGNRREEESR
jgi:hypothetical protein